ncbi:MAG: class I SAM-dependent methyltransferase [Bacteroidota bacterium]|nr:class I SAM-dependent methyltransferase [Bacteroidota bacterium]
MKSNDFDAVAPIYDFLANLIFQKNIFHSQLIYITKIPANAEILIIGGGTGKIVNEILKVNPQVKITYVESSKKMLKISISRIDKADRAKIDFLHGDENSLLSFNKASFDIIITNFFLDVFPADQLIQVMQFLKNVLKENGKWIHTDFINPKNEKFPYLISALIKAMYLFFRTFCQLEGKELLNFKTYFQNLGFQEEESHLFFHKMISAEYYKQNVYN